MPFRLARTAHHAGTHEQAAHCRASQQLTTPTERLRAAAHQNSVAYAMALITRLSSTAPHSRHGNTKNNTTRVSA